MHNNYKTQLETLEQIKEMVKELEHHHYDMFNAVCQYYDLWEYIFDGNDGTINAMLAEVGLPTVDYGIDYINDIPNSLIWDDGTYPFTCEEDAEDYVVHILWDIFDRLNFHVDSLMDSPT